MILFSLSVQNNTYSFLETKITFLKLSLPLLVKFKKVILHKRYILTKSLVSKWHVHLLAEPRTSVSAELSTPC